MRTDLFFADNYPLCKYESELILPDTIIDGDVRFDVTGSDRQDHTVKNIRKSPRRKPETYCENSTAPELSPKKKPVQLKKNKTNVIKKKNMKKEHFCPQCSRAYSYARNLQRHLRFECDKNCKFACPYCKHKSQLLGVCHRHVRRCHKGQPVYADELY